MSILLNKSILVLPSNLEKLVSKNVICENAGNLGPQNPNHMQQGKLYLWAVLVEGLSVFPLVDVQFRWKPGRFLKIVCLLLMAKTSIWHFSLSLIEPLVQSCSKVRLTLCLFSAKSLSMHELIFLICKALGA